MLSVSKILLLAVIIGAVVFGARLLGRARKAGRDVKAGPAGTKSENAVDLAKCRICGAFVDPAVGGCGRGDCPYA